MARFRKFFLVGISLVMCLIPHLGAGQLRISENKNDFTLLQLSAGFLYVVKEARISLDSCLLITSQRHHLSRIPIITEGFDKSYPLAGYEWMDKVNISSIPIKINSLKGKERARLLLSLGAFYAFKPESVKSINQSAIKYLTLAQQECVLLGLKQWIAQCQILLGKCQLIAGNIDEAKKSFALAITYATQSNDLELEAKAYNYEGMYCPFQANTMGFRIDCIKKAVALFETLGDRSNQINSLMDIAYPSFAMGKIQESKLALLKSIALQREIRFPYIHYSYDLSAFLSRITGNYPEELKMALLEVKSAELSKDSLGLAYFYMRLGESYVESANHIEESSLWYKKALNEFIRYGGDPALYRLFSNDSFLANNFVDHKSTIQLVKKLLQAYPPTNTIEEQDAYIALGGCYLYNKQFKDAEKYYLMAEKLEAPNRLLRGNIQQGYIYSRLSALYTEMKNHKLNRFYSSKYLTLSKDSLGIISAYYNLFEADSALGDFSKMRNLYMYAMLNKKLYTKQRNKLVEELDVQYNTLQKEKALEIYKARNLLQAQKAETTRRITYAGLIILILTIVIIWLRYNNKRKSNEQLQLQKAEIDRKNLQLQNAIAEKDDLLISKEWLLKEVHHRVKNNLQLVMSLLTSQSAYLKDEAALSAVLESQHRVQAMSLIHQKLYKNNNMSSIYLPEYINDLLNYLRESYRKEQHVTFERKVDPVYLDVIQAIPLGLIINEVITNSIKYAFPFGAEDTITVCLTQAQTGEISLKIIDNGSGLPAGFDASATNSFGMKLIKGLTNDLDGSFSLSSSNGTIVEIRFYTTTFR